MNRRHTDAEFNEIVDAILHAYEMSDLPEDASPMIQEFIGPDGGLLSALLAWKEERQRRDPIAYRLSEIANDSLRAALARNGRHRVAVDQLHRPGRNGGCIHCTALAGRPITAPCDTLKALHGIAPAKAAEVSSR